MEKKVMSKWVKALRSGKFKQGHCGLKEKDPNTKVIKFCCLGVAREIGLCKASPGNFNDYVTQKFLPTKIQENLAYKNDDSGWSFKKIANYIEKNYKEW